MRPAAWRSGLGRRGGRLEARWSDATDAQTPALAREASPRPERSLRFLWRRSKNEKDRAIMMRAWAAANRAQAAAVMDEPKRSFTWRSLFVGLGAGSMLCCTNMYFGLQTGWVTMGSLQSALLGFGFFKMLQARGLGMGFDAAENVIVQTTAVATATMPLAAGFVGIIPAFGLLTVEENPPDGPFSLSHWGLLGWSCALAFFGVFFAVPLREQVILREKLPFPSGTATAKVIAILHNEPFQEEEEGNQAHGQGSPTPTPVNPALYSIPSVTDLVGSGGTSSRASSMCGEDNMASPFCTPETNDRSVSFAQLPLVPHATMGLHPSEVMTPRLTERTLRRTASAPAPAWNSTLPLLEQAHSGLPQEALEELEEDQTQWSRTWAALVWSILGTMALTILTSLVPALGHFPVFDWLGIRAASAWGWEIVPSFGYIGQGMIMGPRTCISMLAGALLGYAVLGPYVRHEGWAPGPIQDWETGAAGWVLWISLAIMLGDSLTSLALLSISYAKTAVTEWRDAAREKLTDGYQRLTNGQHTGAEGPRPMCKPIPSSWWISGLILSTLMCTSILTPMFSLKIWEPVFAVAVAMLVAVLAIRALGETDLNPVSGVGKLSQIVFALVAPGNVMANLVAGAVAEAGAQQSGDMMQDFKTAQLLGVCPRAQFVVMLVGSGVSVIVSVLAYSLYTTAWPVPGPMFPVPTAQIWLSMARLVDGGELLPHVWEGAIFAAAAAAFLPLLAAWLSLAANQRSARDARWWQKAVKPATAKTILALLPSGVGFAVGMYVSPKFTLPRVFGMAAEQAWRRISPHSHTNQMIVVASGLVLGEGTASLVLAIIKSAMAAT